MSDYNFDVGPNVEQLGFAYLFFRYVWPVILGLAVIIFLGIFLIWFLQFAVSHPIQFMPVSTA